MVIGVSDPRGAPGPGGAMAPTTGSGVVASCRVLVASWVGVPVLLAIEEAVQGGGGVGGGGEPDGFVWVGAHAARMVDGSADGTFEYLVRSAGSVGVGRESRVLDDGAPFPHGVFVGSGWVNIDVPGWVTLSLAGADVLLLDEVEAFDFD